MNHKYALMGCVCLLDTSQLSKRWNFWAPPPSFLFHIDFLMVLAFYCSNNQILNFAKIYSVFERNAV